MQLACTVTLLPVLHHADGSVQEASAGGGAASRQASEASRTVRDKNTSFCTLEGSCKSCLTEQNCISRGHLQKYFPLKS